MGKIIGIDLGTGFSVSAVTEGRQSRVLVNSEGSRLTPSVVAFLEDGTRIVGKAAKNQASINPTRTIASVKRLMGRRRCEVVEEEKLCPYKLVGELNDLVQIEIDGKRYYPQQISAMILQDIKTSAEKALGGEKITQCVVTVPAYFGDSARNATCEACEIAGMKVARIVNEPTAAALAYGLDSANSERIIVIDSGTGTTDFTVLECHENVFQVLSTNGDLFLGGDNFDHAVMDFVADEFKKTTGADLRLDPLAKQRLIDASEKAKCDLSSMPQTTINLPYIAAVGGTPKHLTQVLTRSKFEQLCDPLFNRFRTPITQVLSDAKMAPAQIQQVVLVGGSCRIPKIVEICKEIFGRDPYQGLNPDEAVALGASLTASVMSGETNDIVLIDVTPLSLGVETSGGLFTCLIPRNSAIPTSKSEVFSTASENQPAVDIHVLQGERRMASGNRTLGRFTMTGIPLQARGKPQIEVLFDIDANGILSVSAKDKNTGKEHKVEIKGSSGLEKTDIDRMVKDAAAYEAEDRSRAELIEIRNKADSLVYNTEVFMRENAKFVSAPVSAAVKQAVDAARAALGTNGSKDQLVTAINNLESVNEKMQKDCFEGTIKQAPPALSPKPPASTPSGQVIDGRFKIEE